MKWFNLKKNKCPSCEKDFGTSSFSKEVGYIVCDCSFRISIKRFSEIVKDMEMQRIEQDYREADSEDIKNELID